MGFKPKAQIVVWLISLPGKVWWSINVLFSLSLPCHLSVWGCKWWPYNSDLTPLDLSLSPLLAHLWPQIGEHDRADRLPAVSHPVHPDVQVLPLHTRDPHHHPPPPLHLSLPGRPHLSRWYFTNNTKGMFVRENSDFSYTECNSLTTDLPFSKKIIKAKMFTMAWSRPLILLG